MWTWMRDFIFKTVFWPPDDNGDHDDDSGGGVWLPRPDCYWLQNGCTLVSGPNTEHRQEREEVKEDTTMRHVYHLFSKKESKMWRCGEKDEKGRGPWGWERSRGYSWPHTETLSHFLWATQAHTHMHACVLASTQGPCGVDPYSSPPSLYVIPHS